MSESLSKWHAVGLAGSLAVHLGAYSVLGTAGSGSRSVAGPSLVEFELPPPPPPVPELPESPQPESDDEAAPTVPAAPQEPPPQLAPDPEPEEQLPEEPVELTGLTLTNDGSEGGWSSQVGNGRALRGPIRRPTPRSDRSESQRERGPVRPASVRRQPKPKEPELVPVGDLARRPAPPPLNGKLVSNYPPEARRKGQEGVAVVTARIESNGRIRVASVASESAPGFGEACRRTVVGSVWSPPLDATGRAVATQIRYTCQFRVDR